ncbi:MAG: hypothetical protein K2M22_04230 [Lachnospiraceae bacterium]|nr:hypothetical protein [Lachnospiraceae bacterium]MDE7176724.1 hypothetical protein [Lachnospiraceae bacterium]
MKNITAKTSHDFIWGIENKEDNRVIGIIEVSDVENGRLGNIGYRVNPDF